MTRTIVMPAVLLALLVAATVPPMAAEDADPTPATGPAAASDLLNRMAALTNIRAAGRDEAVRLLRERVPRLLELLAEMEKTFPQAKEVHRARYVAMRLAHELAHAEDDAAMAKRASAIAKAVLASDAPPALKLFADFTQTRLTVDPIGAPDPGKDAARKAVRAFVARHAAGELAARALTGAVQLAASIEDRELVEELARRLAKDHPDTKGLRRLMRQLGYGLDVGKPFKASLTRLDGSTLTLPDDLLGKVLVIDFWATWCKPCRDEIPHMKELYARYKPKGVEFVGISLDHGGRKDDLAQFVDRHGMSWVHTYSSKGWQDPTARRYAVRGIPSIWVVGPDGKIVSENARGTLAETIEKALKTPATAPAAK